MDLVGLDFLWKICMNVPDFCIAESAISLLLNVSYISLSARYKRVSFYSFYIFFYVSFCFEIVQWMFQHQVALRQAETRMVRWMCGVKLQDRVPSKGLRERLGLDDIILLLQQNRLRWYGHVLWKEDSDWVKKCMDYEVEGARPWGRPKKTWREIVE